MRSTMMDVPLLVPSLLEHAALHHGDTEIASRTVEGPIHRTTYAKTWRRTGQLANAFNRFGLVPGDRVGTLAWNTHRHLEVYYGTASAGMVCHTINPRLFPEQIAFIINHGRDRLLFLDLSFVDLVASIADKLTTVEAFIVLTDRAHMPAQLPGALSYEEVLAAEAEEFTRPAMAETDAATLCYTSGTTGDPKGVLYSHRSMVLHAMTICQPDAFALGACSAAMPVVPMFHVNAWGLPHAAPLVGAKLVLPGPKLDGESLHQLIQSEGVTFAAGVPTIWMGLLDHAASVGGLGPLKRVVVGGSALPPVMFERFRSHGVDVVHAWGMTETSPVSLVNTPKPHHAGRSPEVHAAFSAKQGRVVFGVAVRILDANGQEVPHDGKTYGSLQVRGSWVTAGYYERHDAPDLTASGWFDTGDIATMDSDGYVQIVDRTKDMVKSGGEWISSIDLEAIAMAHPAVQEAAVVARPDTRWGERPLLVVVLRSGVKASRDDLLAHYTGKVARWCVPDDVIFVEELPHTATGKLLKARIRELYC